MPYICLHQEGNSSFPQLLEKAFKNNFSLIATTLNCADLPFEFDRPLLKEQQIKYTYGDLLLTPDQWHGKVISILSDTIDCDSEDPVVRRRSEKTLKRDISWAEHLQYCGFTLLSLKSGRNANLARISTTKIKGVLLVKVPLYNPKIAQSVWRRDIDDKQLAEFELEDTWHWWNRFRWAADFIPKLKVVLELSEGDCPSLENVRRWVGEPLEAVIIPSSLFIHNRHNLPVLPKVWQEVLAQFVFAHVNFIVSTDTNDNSLRLYVDYLNNFREIYKDTNTLQALEDTLEIPLQPLYDNLDCYTYDVFEKDPVKYKFYQDAIHDALLDRVPDEEIDESLTVIMVLGAGRGPLVRSAINASEITKRKVRIYIIEKNPNAIRTLNAIANKLWSKKDVHIFSKDMREFSPPEKADILVSELLGSFSDNELSPECLDCAQKLLKPDGISIPCKSTSYINPIMSSKIYNNLRHIARLESSHRDKISTFDTYAETPYVVLLKNVYHISEPQALFDFVHPNNEEIVDNSRYKTLKFAVTMDCVLNGFGGYFDTILYKDIFLSINPLTHTIGMASWFPMFFPISEPLDLKKGQTVEISFWRCFSNQKVWYEWCLTSPVTTQIHNLGGRSSYIYCT